MTQRGWSPPAGPWKKTDERRLQIALQSQRRQGLLSTASAYTATLAEDVILADASGGAQVITLPLAADRRKIFLFVKKIDASANTVTIQPSGGETIDGAASLVIATQYQCYTILSDGVSAWYIA